MCVCVYVSHYRWTHWPTHAKDGQIVMIINMLCCALTPPTIDRRLSRLKRTTFPKCTEGVVGQVDDHLIRSSVHCEGGATRSYVTHSPDPIMRRYDETYSII